MSNDPAAADPAAALIVPDASMYVWMEHPDAITGVRIKLIDLGPLLATGSLPDGTVLQQIEAAQQDPEGVPE